MAFTKISEYFAKHLNCNIFYIYGLKFVMVPQFIDLGNLIFCDYVFSDGKKHFYKLIYLSDKSLTRKLVNWKAFSAVREWLLSTGGQKMLA